MFIVQAVRDWITRSMHRRKGKEFTDQDFVLTNLGSESGLINTGS